MDKNKLYRKIPKVDLLLEEEEIQELIGRYSRDTVLEAIHTETDDLRRYIGQCKDEEKALARIDGLKGRIARTVEAMHTPNMRMVINGTGTVLHTNLGRAPICREHMERAADWSAAIPTWSTTWKKEDGESGILILKSFCAG